MGQEENARYWLTKKKAVLKKIAVKIETQYRFIHKREMTGLKRILRERDALIEELIVIDQELAKDRNWESMINLRFMIEDINNQQQAILQRSQQVLQAAIMEKGRIAAELRSQKVHRQVKQQYLNPWASVGRGSLINERG